MSQNFSGGVHTITTTGKSFTTGAASANATIPLDSSGVVPRYVRIASTQNCYVKLGVAGVVATTNEILIQPADSIIASTNGLTHIAYIQGPGGTGSVNIVALENS